MERKNVQLFSFKYLHVGDLALTLETPPLVLTWLLSQLRLVLVLETLARFYHINLSNYMIELFFLIIFVVFCFCIKKKYSIVPFWILECRRSVIYLLIAVVFALENWFLENSSLGSQFGSFVISFLFVFWCLKLWSYSITLILTTT